IWREVALEIRGQAWLGDLSADIRDGRIELRGTVRGQADGPLDLYAILGRFTVIQARVEASKASCSFVAVSDPLPPEPLEPVLKAELVSGSNVLHAAEVPLIKQ